MQRSSAGERRGTVAVAAVALLVKALIVAFFFVCCAPAMSSPAAPVVPKGIIQAQAGIEPGPTEALSLYRHLCAKVRDQIYDPSTLGDWDALVAANESGINSVEDAVTHFNKAVAVAKDPFTFALDPKATAEEHREMSGAGFGGIGTYLIMKINGQIDEKATPADMKTKGQVVVDGLIEGSPAEKAGLQADDIIDSIDGVPARGHTLNEVVQLIRGQVGSKVVLGIVRNGQMLTVTIVRGSIKVVPVKASKLTGEIGYIRISTFMQQDVHELVESVLENELADCHAYIVDLRNNSGGLLNEAIHSAANFLEEGTVVIMKKRTATGHSTRTWALKDRLIYQTVAENGQSPQKEMMQLRSGNLTGSKPVVILVNDRSASASEVFAGALKDNLGPGTDAHRVIIMGTNTFGKGIVQKLIPMPLGTELHVTTARYFSPKGTWFGDGAAHKNGIHPDVVVAPVAGLKIGTTNDNQLQAAQRYLEKVLSDDAGSVFAQKR